jgi:photosystem II stability/assembly factor-like uncharacterized protein
MKAYFTILLFLLINLLNISFAQFSQVGPFGGYIRDITKDKQGRILAATYLGGIFRSSDNGMTWGQIYNDTLNADFRSLVVNQDGHIFAGTDGFGLMRSTDDGVTWQRVKNAFSTSTITALAANAGRLFIGSFDGLFYSDDEGNSIGTVNGISSSTDIYSISVNNNVDLFAGTYYNGGFRSTDNGANWSAINNGLDFNNLIIIGYAFNSAGNIITTNGVSVFLSTDKGDSWTDLNAPAGNYVAVAVGMNEELFAAGLNAIYSSTDNGTNWTKLNNFPEYSPPVSKLFYSNGFIYAGTVGIGIYNSSDNGNNWNLDINGMTNTHINKITLGPNDELYAATTYAGIFYSSDDGETWQNRTNNIPVLALSSINSYWITTAAVNPKTGTVLVSTKIDGCYRSTDMGMTWEKINSLGAFQAVTFEFNSDGEIYTGSFGKFYKSTDDGVTWLQKFPNVSPISDIAIDRNDNIYLATDGQGVSLSTDRGDNWNPINDGLDDLNVKNILAFGDTSSLKKTSGHCGEVTCGTKDKIFDYNGTKWTLTAYDIRILNQMKVISNDPQRTSDASFAYTALLLYARDPECAIQFYEDARGWKEISECLAKYTPKNLNKEVKSGTDDIEFFIGTKGEGIYKGFAAPTGVESKSNLIPAAFSLMQNYPNPFNPSTIIQFDLPNESLTKLEIFNILGKRISTLVSEKLVAGTYKYEWKPEGMPSGIYFYRLNTGKFTKSEKMLLLK